MAKVGGGSLFGMTILGAAVITVASVSAVNYLSERFAPTAQFAASKSTAPVRQSIAGLKSVLDPVTTGSVPRNMNAVVLDPCTGARKN